MKNKQIMRAAVLTYANEVAKNLARINYLLENVKEFKQYSNLLETASDAKVFEAIFSEGLMDTLKKGVGKAKSALGIGEPAPVANLATEEQAVVKVLRDKIAAGMKELPSLSKVSIDEPTNLGVALDKMVDVVKDVKDSADVFERMFKDESLGADAREELEAQVPELMKAKMGLFGMVAFKLTELRKEAQAALQKLVSIVPSGQLAYALKLAQGDYSPSVPMKSAGSQVAAMANMGSRAAGGLRENQYGVDEPDPYEDDSDELIDRLDDEGDREFHAGTQDFEPDSSTPDWNDHFSNDRESGKEGMIDTIMGKLDSKEALTPEEVKLLKRELQTKF